MHRQAQYSLGRRHGVRRGSGNAAVTIGRLLADRRRIMHCSRDPFRFKGTLNRNSVIYEDRVLREDARAVLLLRDPLDAALAELPIVAIANFDPLSDFALEMLQFRKDDGALQRIHSAADADPAVMI